MNILAIDTSCDDTSAAVTCGQCVLSSIVSSQIDLHKEFEGVVPSVARRAHQEQIAPVVAKALQRAFRLPRVLNHSRNNGVAQIIKVGMEKIDAVAVTHGPGLAIALEVGVEFAKTLGHTYGKKLIAVNHIEGHVLSVLAQNAKGNPQRNLPLPALALTVSGGHTNIVLIKQIGQYELLGQTLDDAAGEALDKAAKLMGLGYPGGAVVEQLAKGANTNFLPLPRPMKHSKDLNFSFSGLKTAFYYTIRDWPKDRLAQNIPHLSATFQTAVFDSLVAKFKQAVDITKPQALVAVGGVLANRELRKRIRGLGKLYNLPVFFPYTTKLNTDNAGMIGVAGFYQAQRGDFVTDINSLDREPRAKL